jgi:hypothetical protein
MFGEFGSMTSWNIADLVAKVHGREYPQQTARIPDLLGWYGCLRKGNPQGAGGMGRVSRCQVQAVVDVKCADS